ncbi:MAG: DUF5453 family protein [Mycoplasmataceae bacterium]|nr:DUF5453 family protein [Mycoplasmataceae bacterium]
MENKVIAQEPKEKAVNLTWTWYLFLIANILVVVGISISWGINGRGVDITYAWIPVVICNCIAIILIALFYFFDSKEIYLVKQHVPQKYFKLYFVAGFVFIANLIFIFTFIACLKFISSPTIWGQNWLINGPYAILFGVSALISLISVGLYRYARFKIDLTLLRRRRGETITEQPSQPIEPTKDETPTTGLTSNADQQ